MIVLQGWPVIRYYKQQHEIFEPVFGKNEVSIETLLIFLFYCGQVSRENCCKNGGYYFIIFLASKMKLTDGFMNFKWHKIMKPPDSVGKKMNLTAAAKQLAVSFIFFRPNLAVS